MTDWSTYRKCSVCAALIGRGCTDMTGLDDGGGLEVPRSRPHTTRKLRVGRGR